MKSCMNNMVLLIIISSTLQILSNKSINPGNKCEFVILIPSFNNEKYYEENLDSACWQSSTNPYHIYYINDASTDATGKLVEEYVKKNNLEDKITIIQNPMNVGPCANTYNIIHSYIENHKIVVILDGDDKFPHNNVLHTLEEIYKDPDIWMTYGRLETFPKKEVWGWEVPEAVINDNRIRAEAWACHLRTFRAPLYKKIKKESFYYEGAFMRVTHDLAFSLAMLEMCRPKNGIGKNHSMFVHEVLYQYRLDNPLSDFRIKSALQKKVDQYVRSSDPYESLETLDLNTNVG